MKEARTKLTLALDVKTMGEAVALVQKTKNLVGYYKVGKEILNAVGLPTVVTTLKKMGVKVFVDVKEMDIPNTVKNAVIAAAQCGADIINVHASGGYRMMIETVEAAKEVNPDVKIIAVSILTSLDDKDMIDIGYFHTAETMVWQLAELADLALIDGLVCSPKELSVVRQILGPDAFIITPGITPEWTNKQNDQKRVTTPRQAVLNGCSTMVVGRAITKSDDPHEAAYKILKEIADAMQEPAAKQQTLKDILVDRLLQAGIVKTGRFTLKNGSISPIYINVRDLAQHRNAMSMVIYMMSQQLNGSILTDYIGGVPMGALSLANLLAWSRGLKILTLRATAKDHGLVGSKTVESFTEGETVLVIEDVATSGGSIKEAVDSYRALNLKVEKAFVVVDRQQGASQMLANEGVKLYSLITLDEIVTALCKRDDIDETTKQEIKDYVATSVQK